MTEYSLALTKRPRQLDKADQIVEKTLEIIEYFRPESWILENPRTGLLPNREYMQGIPMWMLTTANSRIGAIKSQLEYGETRKSWNWSHVCVMGKLVLMGYNDPMGILDMFKFWEETT